MHTFLGASPNEHNSIYYWLGLLKDCAESCIKWESQTGL